MRPRMFTFDFSFLYLLLRSHHVGLPMDMFLRKMGTWLTSPPFCWDGGWKLSLFAGAG